MSDAAVRFTAKMQGGFTVARLLRRYPEKVGRTLESLVKQEARGLAVELARNTRPFGFSEKAKKRGEKVVADDINLVFGLPSKVFSEIRKSDPGAADRFWAHIANRRFARAQSALRSSGSGWNDLSVGRLDPKLHKQAPNTRGEVPRRVNPSMIVTSPKALDTYNRDEIRTRPCAVLATSGAKPVPAMPHTARVKLDLHLFSQVDDTQAETHATWAAALAELLRDKAAMRAALDSETFILHDLLARETATTPDEPRGRETILTYEAAVSAV
jgi:hypothetical protein